MKKFLVSTALTALVAGLIALPAGTAAAADACDQEFQDLVVTDASMSPEVVVVGTKAVHSTFTATIETPCAVDSAALVALPEDESSPSENWTDLLITPIDATHYTIEGSTTWRSDALYNADAGTWGTVAVVFHDSANATSSAGFATTLDVVRQAKVTVSAPAKAKKGKSVPLKGKLSRMNWETGAFAGFGKQRVVLQYKPAKGGTFTDVKTVKANAKGGLSTSVKATKDGCYRFVYAGSSTTAAASGGSDCVDVS